MYQQKINLKKEYAIFTNFTWYEDPMKLLNIGECNVLIELIGQEKGYKL